jgi:multidrug efflux pump subunit AcrA (membrane-fusion protein)
MPWTAVRLHQAQANRDLAGATWGRDRPLLEKGWVTPQKGDTDRLNLAAKEAAVAVAESNVKAQQAQLKVLNQEKAYQSVVAPFDGVITSATSTSAAWCRPTRPAAPSCSP